MRTLFRRLLVPVLMFCLATAANAADNATNLSATKSDGTISLFNGKDLSGWTYHLSDSNVKMEDVWTVKDGVITCKGSPAGYIRTTSDYTNYVLRLQWRFAKPGNSGALLRMTGPDQVWPRSIEAQLNHRDAGDIWNIGEFPMKVDPARTNGRHTRKLKESNEKPVGEWNKYEITLDGGNLTLKVNGEVQNQATDCEIVPGKIALQSEGSEIEFRNITLTPLDKWKPLWDGKTLNGWHQIGKGDWRISRGAIRGRHASNEAEYGHLVSDAMYKDFTMRLKYRAVRGNSGVYFRVAQEGDSGISGLQAEIDPAKDAGGLYETNGRGWVVQPKPEDVAKWYKPNDWNEMTISAYGPRIVVKVNGVQTAEIVDDKSRPAGHLALQLHGGQDVRVMFKDIEILGDPVAKP